MAARKLRFSAVSGAPKVWGGTLDRCDSLRCCAWLSLAILGERLGVKTNLAPACDWVERLRAARRSISIARVVVQGLSSVRGALILARGTAHSDETQSRRSANPKPKAAV